MPDTEQIAYSIGMNEITTKDKYIHYASILKEGQVLGYPTDTVWGLAANAQDKTAVTSLYALKQRDSNKPIGILMKNKAMLKNYCAMTQPMSCVIEQLLPGPFTIILPAKKGIGWKTDTIGARMLDREIERELFALIDFPIALTSANLSGHGPAITRDDMSYWEGRGITTIEQQEPMSGEPSPVISLVNDSLEILRSTGSKDDYLRQIAKGCGISVD